MIGLGVVLALSLILVPLAADAQPRARIPQLGYLVLAPLSESPSPERAAFLAGLRELGWIDGKTIAVEYRSAKWNVELLDDLAEELVRMKVDIIVAAGAGAPLRAAQRATKTIPIVMVSSNDLELQATRAAARPLGITLKLMEVKNADDLARVLAVLEKERPDGLTMFFDAKSTGYRALVGDFAKKHKIPTIFGAKEFAQAGGLMSYAPDVVESFRRSATYVDKILKGAKPGDLPIEQPTKFELVINLKTAKALGLTIPPSVLLRADEVID